MGLNPLASVQIENIEWGGEVPSGAAGRISQAGPYFRSFQAFSGDGIIGGSSAGWLASR